MKAIPFAVVGTGWRAEFFMRIARWHPQMFHIVGVVSRGNPAFGAKFSVPMFPTISALLGATRPRFAVSSVTWSVNPTVIRELVSRGIPVLSETPPAPDLKGMAALFRAVARHNGRVQVAEQVHLRPHHQAQIAIARSGKLGDAHEAYVSVSHGYHGISLMRRLLGLGFEEAVITGKQFTAPIMQGAGRQGPPTRKKIVDAVRSLYCFDFGNKMGIVDFTGPQYFGKIRAEHVQVRGTHGEIVNDRVSYLKDFKTHIAYPLTRVNVGDRGDMTPARLAGYQAGGEWLYTNPFGAHSMMDDEIAVAHALLRMDACARTGQDFYPLAEGCQDHYLYLLAQEATATGRPVQSRRQVWAKGG